MEIPLITIEVTPDIAAKIRFLAESGAFAVKDGSATLHFKAGKLTTIKTELYTYASVDKQQEHIILSELA